MVLSTTGGCRVDIHSPTHISAQACHVTARISAGACGCDMGSAAGCEEDESKGHS